MNLVIKNFPRQNPLQCIPRLLDYNLKYKHGLQSYVTECGELFQTAAVHLKLAARNNSNFQYGTTFEYERNAHCGSDADRKSGRVFHCFRWSTTSLCSRR